MNLTTIEGATNFLVALSTSTVYTAGTVIETAADLTAEGDIALLGDKNEVLTAATSAAARRVRFVVKRKGTLRYSDWIYKGNMNFYSGSLSAAATTKNSYLGYNGSSGDMDATSGEDYSIKIIDNTPERLFQTKDMYRFGSYTATASTQENVATGLFESLISDNSYGEPFVVIEMVNNGTGTAANAANTVKVSEGSTTVVVNASSSILNPSVGTYLRFGGTATTYPVYKVASVTGSSTAKVITLEQPYQGTTANLAGTAVATVASPAKYGIKMRTVSRSYFKPGILSNLIFDFELGIKGFTTATITDSQSAFSGNGTYKQMAELEWYHEGHVGEVHRNAGILDNFSIEYMTASGKTYRQMNIGFFDNEHLTAIKS